MRNKTVQIYTCELKLKGSIKLLNDLQRAVETF